MIEIAIKAAKLAGEKLEDYYETILEHEEKADKSFVTAADKEADQIIIDILQKNFPDHQILTEENGTIGKEGEYLWVIDPLDGTLNFTRGIPLFCTSIALTQNKIPILAVIYNPITNSLYTAEKGTGAYWNGEKIAVSPISKVDEAIVSMGRSRDSESKVVTLEIYNKLYPYVKTQRVFGTSALELAWVASGRLEGFISVGLNSWDCYGGILLVQEAGGTVTDFFGRKWDEGCNYFVASNGKTQSQLLEIVST